MSGSSHGWSRHHPPLEPRAEATSPLHVSFPGGLPAHAAHEALGSHIGNPFT